MSARLASQKELIDSLTLYDLREAIDLIKQAESKKPLGFQPSVDLVVQLGINAKQSEQQVKGVCEIDTGRKARLAVIAEQDDAKKALEMGAVSAGMDDLIDDFKAGNVGYDYVITKPEYMKKLGPVARILGPKGIMPNPKLGTVTNDVLAAVEKALKGQVSIRSDKAGYIHCSVGKYGFETDQLMENINKVIKRLRQLKPPSSKGAYIRSIRVSMTMGPAAKVKLSSVDSMK